MSKDSVINDLHTLSPDIWDKELLGSDNYKMMVSLYKTLKSVVEKPYNIPKVRNQILGQMEQVREIIYFPADALIDLADKVLNLHRPIEQLNEYLARGEIPDLDMLNSLVKDEIRYHSTSISDELIAAVALLNNFDQFIELAYLCLNREESAYCNQRLSGIKNTSDSTPTITKTVDRMAHSLEKFLQNINPIISQTIIRRMQSFQSQIAFSNTFSNFDL